MKAAVTILAVLAICLTCITISQGRSLARVQELRCRCINTVDRPMSPKQFLNLDLIPKGPHCKHLELIATLKNGQEVCLEPSASWVKKIIDRLLESSKSTAPTK